MKGNFNKTFKPRRLPPQPELQYDNEMWKLLSDADRKLGRLDGLTEILPNPNLFVTMYVQKEAVLSSQIEGTQASLIDVLDVDRNKGEDLDILEIVNYVKAVNFGLSRLDSLPLCLRLIREIHQVLLETGRGSNRNPGEFRESQNWIGPEGSTLETASFVPPTVPDMQEALNDLEIFMAGDEEEMPSLVKIALIHAQFETIHPFLDGNGRVGRLMITFWLCAKKILSAPLLYLSYYFKQNRIEYYDRLMEVRKKGDWEGWVKYFLKGVAVVADEATESAKKILALKERYALVVSENSNLGKLLDMLFEHLVVTKSMVTETLGVSYPTANVVVEKFVELGILVDITPNQQRNKKYYFEEYMNILQRGTEL